MKQAVNPVLGALLLEAYAPCGKFGLCKEARWDPSSGHVPRGFVGATRSLDEVEVILVFSEPGHPQADESYRDAVGSRQLLTNCAAHTQECFAAGASLFHRNVRWFLGELFPDQPFEQQLQKAWLTEGRLCSLENSIGSTIDPTCARHYLSRQIELMPQATIVGFGRKAKKYLQALNVNFIPAYAMAPPGANHKPARPSWERAIKLIKQLRCPQQN